MPLYTSEVQPEPMHFSVLSCGFSKTLDRITNCRALWQFNCKDPTYKGPGKCMRKPTKQH